MTEADIRPLLERQYNREDWLALIREVFVRRGLRSEPSRIPFSNDDLIEEAFELGTMETSDRRLIGVYELKVTPRVWMERNRVSLRNSLRGVYKQVDGAFVVFNSGNRWRFSYVSEIKKKDADGNLVDASTEAKRFTYLMGEGEKCRTAAQRFAKLATKEEVLLDDIQEAFSVEKLNKEFFKKYKEHYEKFWQWLASKPAYRRDVFGIKTFRDEEENIKAQKPIRDFAKLLLGRIVFLHFLQRKGWMGCPPDQKKWSGGDPDFLKNLFQTFRHPEKFYSKCLTVLFFDTLNNEERDNFIFKITGTRIPYLNGGLFDDDFPEAKDIDFPVEFFGNLLEFFSQYNFTIDENSPEEHEVGIDPEMLGHIFENLLEENRGKGTFYTPKEIVQYMCRESLIQYLKTHIIARTESEANRTKQSSESNEMEGAIETFIRLHELSPFINAHATQINQLLRDIKICDPAIGSGAFPMGMFQEIYRARTLLIPIVNPNNFPSSQRIKKEILHHNLYGVDIEKGAVDIARLRYWLALIVDASEPQPLPNLDYKIMQGNSLLESFEGIDLSKIAKPFVVREAKAEQGKIFIDDKQSQIFDYAVIEKLVEDYFEENDPEEKDRLHKEIDAAVLTHIRLSISDKKDILKAEIQNHQQILWDKMSGVKNDEQLKALREDSKEARNIAQFEDEYAEADDKFLKLRQLEKINERPYFLWHLFFKEVFDEGGFDIVIGNPPYVGERGNESIFHDVAETEWGRKFYTRWMDYFYFFIHKGTDLVKDNGLLFFITTNYYFTATGGHKLRSDLRARTNILSLINFNELKIFESATGQHNALLLLRKAKDENVFAKNLETKRTGLASPSILRLILESSDSQTNYYSVNENDLFEGEDFQIRIKGKGSVSSSLTVNDVLQKVKQNSDPLSTIADITMGIVTLSDTVSSKHLKKYKLQAKKGDGIYVLSNDELNKLHLSKDEKKDFIRPFYKNSDIKKYYSSPNHDSWLIYVKDAGKPIKLPSGLRDHFEKFKPLLVGLKENFLKNKIAASVVKKWLANGNYFTLFTPKKEVYFTGNKIIFPYRSRTNIFSYNATSWFGSKDIGYILLNEHLSDFKYKYLLAILNSKLIFNWLYNKGKRKGEILELYATPLSDVPIKRIDKKQQDNFISIVEKIIAKKKVNMASNIANEEKQLDIMVYHLYGLSFNEAIVIDKNLIKKDFEQWQP